MTTKGRWGFQARASLISLFLFLMAAALLVALYEYSPLFYIALVFVCFLVTSGLVMGWFGWDVPVILRNSEETESNVKVSQKQMRQVKNPFSLEIKNPEAASASNGIILVSNCLEDCLVTCYWGCSVQKVHDALQKHAHGFRIKTPQSFENAMCNEYLYCQQYCLKKTEKEEKHCQLPEEAEINDFGLVPRSRYPLVVLLTLADEDNRVIYDILVWLEQNCGSSGLVGLECPKPGNAVLELAISNGFIRCCISMVSIIHIPDDSYRLSCRILYQYLLLSQGQFHDLKQLFMSANNASSLSGPLSGERTEDHVPLEKSGLVENESEVLEESSKDCIVCQNRAVNWVLLPCRHTCLCDECVKYFQQCPMCRQFVGESFPLCI